MIVRQKGGMTEFIPSPREKREGLIRDHILGLVENLHQRIRRLECETGLAVEEAETFAEMIRQIKNDESLNLELHAILSNRGYK